MMRTAHMLPVLFLLSGACGVQRAPAREDSVSARLVAACPMSVRAVDTKGSATGRPIIEPKHVATLVPAKALYKGEVAVLVTLTTQGEARMLRYTRKNVGRSVIVFCGDNEISRALITAPFANRFRVTLPGEGSN